MSGRKNQLTHAATSRMNETASSLLLAAVESLAGRSKRQEDKGSERQQGGGRCRKCCGARNSTISVGRGGAELIHSGMHQASLVPCQ